MKLTAGICLLILLTSSLLRPETPQNYVVSYVSAEHVYIDAGREDGLEVGDHLLRVVNGKTEVDLEVVFVARHSASCRQLDTSGSVGAGDRLTLAPRGDREVEIQTDSKVPLGTPELNVPVESPSPVINALNERPGVPVKVFGNASMLLYHWQDRSDANLDFTQSSARLNMRAENVWFEHLTFSIRTRGRYDIRGWHGR